MTRASRTSRSAAFRDHRPLAIAIALALLPVGGALAQEAPQAQTEAAPQAADESEVANLDRMVVTGSRIRREPGFEGPAPTMSVSSEQIETSGHTQIIDLVNQLPGFTVSQTSQTSNQSNNPGVNAIDLRGMGVQRTLTLVDGRRQVSSVPGTASVDVSTLPAGMIERVEVVTGGASALYGADAVNGVANFILKKDFDGLELGARYGDSTRGDMPTYTADVLFGKNFADYRGNFTLYGFWEDSSGVVMGQDRPWTADGYPMFGRANTSSRWETLDGVRNIYNAQDAQVMLGNCGPANYLDCLYSFTPDGQLRRPDLGPGGLVNPSDPGNVLQQGVTDGGEYGGRYDSWYLVTPSDRQAVRSTIDFDVTDSMSVFGVVNYSQNKSYSSARSLSAYGSDIVPGTSPFITAEMIAANGGPLTNGVAFARHFDEELGHSRTEYDRKLLQVTAGVEGMFDLFDRSWSYSGYYSYGRSRQEVQSFNAASSSRLSAGLNATLDASGNPVCVNGPAGCVAINPFRRLTPEMVDWLTYDTDASSTTLTQKVASAYVSGGLFDLPGGEAQLVLGTEYRKERNDIGAIAQFNPEHPDFDPTLGATQNTLVGEFSVKEVFGELSLPLLSGVTGAQRLSLDLAGRLSDYSTAGRTNTSKIGLEWAPIDDISLRGTYGKAVRAPNIGELYTAGSVSGAWVYDPCNDWALDTRSDVTEYTAVNCAAISPTDTSVANYWQWRDIVYSGNVDLKPETAKTLTYGFVLRPRFVDNLVVSADYYRIDLRDVISTLGYQSILNRCVDQASLDNSFCDLVTRDANGDIVEVGVRQLNLSQRIARGIDINASWFRELGGDSGADLGRLSVNLSYGRTLQRTDIADPERPQDGYEYVTLWGTPKWKGSVRTGWSNDRMGFYWTLRHLSPMRNGRSQTEENYVRPWAGNLFYSDFYGNYRVKENVNVYAGLNNAFDRAPPRVPNAEAGGAAFNQTLLQAGLYDSLGRTFHVGVRVDL